MILFISFLSSCIAVSILWSVFIISYLSSGKIESSTAFIVSLMGLFLPFVLILMAIAFVYVCLELKKTQLILKDWMNILKRDILNDTNAVHNQIGEELKAAMKQPTPTVMNISMNDPIEKYKNMNLPDDVELHFTE